MHRGCRNAEKRAIASNHASISFDCAGFVSPGETNPAQSARSVDLRPGVVKSATVKNRRVLVTSRSARVSIRAVEGAEVSVDDGELCEVDGEFEITTRSKAVSVTVPTGTDVVIGVGSGRVECIGRLGSVSVTSASGSIDVEHGSQVDVRSRSGRVTVNRCDGVCRSRLKSGTFVVGEAGAVDASSVSGRIEIGQTSRAEVNAVSGRIIIAAGEQPELVAHSVSGTVRITVPHGVNPATRITSLRGSATCGYESGTDGSIDVSTRSGTIAVTQRP